MYVRPARPEEYARLGDMVVRAFTAVPGIAGEHQEHLEQLRDVARRTAENTVLVAEIDGEPAGMVTFVPGPESDLAEFDDADAAGIRALGVDPRYQARGVGRALTQACLDRAAEAGKTKVVLHTTDTMAAAQRLYRSLGFERDPGRDFRAGSTVLRGFVYDFGREARNGASGD